MTGHWFNSDAFSQLIACCNDGSTGGQAARADVAYGLESPRPPLPWWLAQ
jgi:hypothetical protein